MSRPANAAEKRRWEDTKKKLRAIELKVTATALTLRKSEIAISFGAINGFTFSDMEPTKSSNRELQRQFSKWQRLLAGVESEQLGISFPNGISGDFNIIGPESMNEDEAQYYQLGLIVMLGVSLVVAVGALIAAYEYKNNENYVQAKIPIDFIENEAKKDLALATRWEKEKSDKNYHQNDNVISEMMIESESILDSIGSALSSGISWAIPIALVIGAIWISKAAK